MKKVSKSIAYKRSMLKTQQQQQTENTLTAYGMILLLFGLLCLFMQAYFRTGYEASYIDIPLKGGVHGPIVIEQPNSNYKLRLKQYSVALNVWNAVDIEVLDENKNYLFGFGDEFWHESGYDEGRWEETKRTLVMDVHFENAGNYYLSISAQSNAALDARSGYELMIVQQRGSIVAFQWLKFIAFLLGGLILLYRYRHLFEEAQY
jgi:hypothetical protein